MSVLTVCAERVDEIAQVGRDLIEVDLLLEGDDDLLLADGPRRSCSSRSDVAHAGVGQRRVAVHVLDPGRDVDPDMDSAARLLLGKVLSTTGAGTLIVTPPSVSTSFSKPLKPTSM